MGFQILGKDQFFEALPGGQGLEQQAVPCTGCFLSLVMAHSSRGLPDLCLQASGNLSMSKNDAPVLTFPH